MANAAALPAPIVAGTAAPPATTTHRGRSIAAGVLGVLTVLLLAVSIVAVWARATIVDEDRFTDVVAAGLEQPEVQAGLAAYVTEELFSAVDVTAAVNDVVPAALSRLTPTVVAGAEVAVQNVLERALANDDVQELLANLVGRAHNAAMRLLQGDGLVHGVSVDNGEVTLDLLPLLARGVEALQSVGLLEGVTIPDLSTVGNPDEERSQLSAAIGRQLPEGFGQLVVYRSQSLDDAQATVQRAQNVVTIAKRGLWLVILLTVVLLVATIVVAPRRWGAPLILGLGTAAAMSLLRVAARQLVDEAPGLAKRPGARAAMDAMLREASSSLLRLAGIVLLVAVVATLVGMARRGWQREDFVLVAAVVVGTSVVAVAGISIWSILIGIAVGIAVTFLARLLLAPHQPEPPAALAPS